MIRTCRICHKDYSGEAFTGKGARLYGGRFNSSEKPAIYTSGSLSLSLLDMLVQTNDRSYFSSCVVLYAAIPRELISEHDSDSLPAGWDAVPYGSASQKFGDEWLVSQSSAVIKVPSVIVPAEHNYIINPSHRDFEKIRSSSPEKLPYDERLTMGPHAGK
ncbi:MAG: RES family NAD+ phosphorylase [Balneolaceae bacterium]